MTFDSAYPKPLEALINIFRRLPGIGQRNAERLALALLQWPEEELQRFGRGIATLKERICFCEICGNLADSKVCHICSSSSRNHSEICVVEQASQILTIEKSASYHGLYHVLGGRIVPLQGKGPDDLRINELRQRVQGDEVRELILATSPDVEGEATANFIAAEFEALPIRITRIAAGVPVGSDLSFADAATMAMALRGRRSLREK